MEDSEENLSLSSVDFDQSGTDAQSTENQSDHEEPRRVDSISYGDLNIDLPDFPQSKPELARQKLEEICPNFLALSLPENSKEIKSAICARTLWPSEPCYTCNLCAQDETTIMCKSCFDNSKHKDHPYTISSSCGDGSCDCGDVEAWKSHPGCGEHLGQDSHSPEQIKDLCGNMFESIFNHELPALFRLLENTLLMKETSDDPSESLYNLVLFNDEINSFEWVTDLINAITSSQSRVKTQKYAHFISNIGALSILTSDFDKCLKAKTVIDKFVGFELNFSSSYSNRSRLYKLKNLIIPNSSYDSNFLSLDIIKHLNSLSILHQYLMSAYLLNVYCSSSTTLNWYLQNEPCIMKESRCLFIKLFSTPCLKFFDLRIYFSQFFSDNFVKIYRNSVESKDHRSTLLFDQQLQIYTVNSIVCQLLSKENILLTILNLFIHGFNQYVNDDKSQPKFLQPFKLFQLTHSLKYSIFVLSHEPLNPMLETKVLESCIALIDYCTTTSIELGSISFNEMHKSHIDVNFASYLQVTLYQILDRYAQILIKNKNYFKVTVLYCLHAIENLFAGSSFEIPDKLFCDVISDLNFDPSRYKIPLPYFNLPLELFTKLIHQYLSENTYLNSASSVFDDIFSLNIPENFLSDVEFINFSLTKVKEVKKDSLKSLFIYKTMLYAFVPGAAFYSRRCNDFIQLQISINNYHQKLFHYNHCLSQLLACYLIENNQFDISIYQTIFNSFYKEDFTESNIMIFSFIHFLMSLFYYRNFIISNSTKSEFINESILQYALLKPHISQNRLLDFIWRISDHHQRYNLTEVLRMKQNTKRIYFEPDPEFINLLNILSPGLSFISLQTSSYYLKKLCFEKKINYFPKKPNDLEQIFYALEDFSFIKTLIDFFLSKFQSSINDGLDFELYYLYTYYIIINSNISLLRYLKDNIFLNNLYNNETLNDDKSKLFRKSFNKIFKILKSNDDLSKIDFKTALKSLYNESSTSEQQISINGEISSHVRSKKLNRIAQLQEKFKKNNPNLFLDTLTDNPVSSITQISNVLFSNNNTRNYDLSCLVCHEKATENNPLFIMKKNQMFPVNFCNPNKESSPQKINEVLYTCGHHMHKKCFNNNTCSICLKFYKKSDCLYQIPNFEENTESHTQLDFISWINCFKDEIIGHELVNFPSNYKMLSDLIMWKTECCIRKKDELLSCFTDYQTTSYSFLFHYPPEKSEEKVSIEDHNLIGCFFLSILQRLNSLSFNSINDTNLVKLFYILNKSTYSLENSLDENEFTFFLKYMVLLLSVVNNKEVTLPNKYSTLFECYEICIDCSSITNKEKQHCLSVFNGSNFPKIFNSSVKAMTNYFNKVHLKNLPMSYDEFLFKYLEFTCPTFGCKNFKVLCLVCGELMCNPGFCCMDSSNVEEMTSFKFIQHCTHKQAVGIEFPEGYIFSINRFKSEIDFLNLDGLYTNCIENTNISGKRVLNQKKFDYLEMLWFEQK